MTNEEFSNNFSTLLNSYGSVPVFGEAASKAEIVLNEYEKSTFLTQAQDIIVKSYYDARLNTQGQGFDDSARRQVDFSSLIKVAQVDASNITTGLFDERGVIFQLPRRAVTTATTVSEQVSETVTRTTTTYVSTVTDSPADDNTDVLVILNEKLLKVKTTSGEPSTTSVEAEYVIKPISYLEYDREMSKAYTKPLKKQAWRLFQNQSVGFDVMSEIIPRETLSSQSEYSWKYRLRYVKRPRPIVLEDLPDGLSIDGISDETTCELNPILHNDILMKAVELAYMSRARGEVQEPKNN